MKYMTKKSSLLLTGLFIALTFFVVVFRLRAAGDVPKVDYGNNPVIIDSDLDGLTDEGEKQLYHTDPQNPDSDGDGILDGAEIIGGSDPLDQNSPSAKETVTERTVSNNTVPWVWYVTRSSALVGFFLLYLSFLFGLAIRTSFVRKLISPADAFSVHCWISLQALVFALVHGVSLLFDKMIIFSWKDILVPFVFRSAGSGLNVPGADELVAFGVLSFYLMIALVITSYSRRFISQKVWRSIHFMNIGLYILSFLHALYLGTDLKSGVGREIFIIANAILAVLLVVRLIAMLIARSKQHEDIRESVAPVEPERSGENL